MAFFSAIAFENVYRNLVNSSAAICILYHVPAFLISVCFVHLKLNLILLTEEVLFANSSFHEVLYTV